MQTINRSLFMATPLALLVNSWSGRERNCPISIDLSHATFWRSKHIAVQRMIIALVRHLRRNIVQVTLAKLLITLLVLVTQ